MHPLLLFSTSSASMAVIKAYSYAVQGYFVKPDTIEELTVILKAIITYWDLSESPK